MHPTLFELAQSHQRIFIILACCVLTLVTVFSQFEYNRARYGEDYVSIEHFQRHEYIMDGTAESPFRYRILSDYILEAGLVSLRWVGLDTLEIPLFKHTGKLSPFEIVSFLYRCAQNLIIFLFGFLYFRSLGLSLPSSLLGLTLAAYGMSFAFFNTDLAFYTYTEVACFIIAAYCINIGKMYAVIFITALAAFDRESSILIPLLLAGAIATKHNIKIFSLAFVRLSSSVLYSLIAFIAVFAGLRLIIGPASYSDSAYGDFYPGIQLLALNLKYHRTWTGLAQMFTILPCSLLFYKRWHPLLKQYLLWLGVPWLVVHFIGGSTGETRLFLVPLFIIFIPAALWLVENYRNHDTMISK
jgi:hypothetical protein